MQQISLQQILTLVLSASIVAANSSPSSDMNQHTDYSPNQISTSYGIPVDHQTDRSYSPMDVWVFATINITYNSTDETETQPIERSEKAKYGEGKILNVAGKLVHITSKTDPNDHSGCDKEMLGTKQAPLPVNEPWVALIRRGKCNFEDKVKHAWEHHADGVIVYNDRDSINLDKMKIVGKDRK